MVISWRGTRHRVLGVVFRMIYSNHLRRKSAAQPVSKLGKRGLPPRTNGDNHEFQSPNRQPNFRRIVFSVRYQGYDQISQRLHVLLHEVAWTTSSELMGELGPEILIFQRSPQSLSPELQELLCRCMDVVKQVWPKLRRYLARESSKTVHG